MWRCSVQAGLILLREPTRSCCEARGKYAEAEAAYRRAQSAQREAISLSASWPVKPPPGSLEEGLDFLIMSEGLMKVTQRKLAEGESDVRRALISRLKAVGKYHPSTAQASFCSGAGANGTVALFRVRETGA